MTPAPFALIVDDEWRLAHNLMRFMQRRGYDAKAVTSVNDANAAIIERCPDLALIDLKLPDISGAELCRMLSLRYPRLPLVVMSAHVDPNEAIALRRAGVQHVLTKPFALAQLQAVLDDIAGGRVPEREAAPPPKVTARPAVTTGPARRPKIVLYSHDTMGLGHMRRNILIARSLTESRLNASVLLVSGAREIGRFELPGSIDCLVLPSYRKSTSGEYQSRHLDLQTKDLVNLRANAISSSVLAFDPDVFVADNVPRGALNELDPVLSRLHARGKTRLVLGLRDILDDPETTQREWQQRKNLEAIQWHYDQVWIYGDKAIYDLCEAYRFGDDFTSKARFAGYLDARRRAAPRASELSAPAADDQLPNGTPYNLCLVGGGQDGFELAAAFAAAAQPSGTIGLLITGPFMEAAQIEQLQTLAAARDDLNILGFVQEPTRLLCHARRVVAMGGYNTVNEVLAFDRPTLIVPRIRPRLEQLVRAERLAELGYVDVLHPDQLTAEAVSQWLAKPQAQLPVAASPINLGGLDELTRFVEQLMSSSEKQYE